MLKLKCRLKSVVVATGIVVTGALVAAPATVRAESPTSYTVVAGDYLYGIAQRHKVSLAALLAANGLEATSLILPGMTLALPSGASAPTAAPAKSAQPAAAPSTATTSGATYTVVSGDYLYGIASKNRVRLNDLLAVNGLELTSMIHPGMALKLPGNSSAAAPAAAPAAPAVAGGDYVIKVGDSLYAIARRHGVTLNALLSSNGIDATALLLPGRTLKLPAGAAAAAPAAASAATAEPAAAPAAASGLVYTVQRNDSLSLIASRANTRLSALLALNGLTMSSMIHPGDQLKLPDGATVPTAASAASAPSTASAGPAAPTPASAKIAPSGNAQIDAVLDFARAQIGKPYKFFTAGPDSYDCSGLVKAAFATIGLALPHQSFAQSKFGTPVDWYNEDIRPGDLVFKYSSTNLTVISHVGIAISSTQMIHAPNAGSTVRVAAIPADSAIVAVQRLIP